MSLVLWLFFVLLNGKLNGEIALLGAAVAALGLGFAHLALDWNWKKELRLFRLLPGLICYGAWLFGQIVRANLATLRRVYARREPQPAIAEVRTRLERRWQRVLLANTITLTPGTITLELHGDLLTVHCLDRADAEDLPGEGAQRRVERLEGRA